MIKIVEIHLISKDIRHVRMDQILMMIQSNIKLTKYYVQIRDPIMHRIYYLMMYSQEKINPAIGEV
jgi:hypothetical protein